MLTRADRMRSSNANKLNALLHRLLKRYEQSVFWRNLSFFPLTVATTGKSWTAKRTPAIGL